MSKKLAIAFGLALALVFPRAAQGSSFTFNQAPENELDGWFYAISGGIFPTGNDPNGSRASGGTFARIWDDPLWGTGSLNTWVRDGWFLQNAGMAVTMYNGDTAVYDNNGIDNGTYGNFYSALAQGTTDASTPGLYQMYSNSNNFDHIYATYFRVLEDTTITSINGFFNLDGLTSDFDAFSPSIRYRMNIWSTVGNCQQDNVGCLPVNTGSFRGNILTSDLFGGWFSVTNSGAFREFANGSTDAIGRLTYTLSQPFTLPAGEYYISYDAAIEPVPEPATMVLLGSGLLGLAARRRLRRQARRH